MIHELSYPLAESLVNRLRDSGCDALRFRQGIGELTRLLCYEAFADRTLSDKTIMTWQGRALYRFIDEEALVFVPILRAGMPMLESVMALFPDAGAGFLAMRRDAAAHRAVLYYDRVPDCEGKTVVLLDPMVATGGSLCDAIEAVKTKGAREIVSLNIIGSPEGVDRVEEVYPDCNVYIAKIDEGLDEQMFIVPGLGDAGDRAYNTVD